MLRPPPPRFSLWLLAAVVLLHAAPLASAAALAGEHGLPSLRVFSQRDYKGHDQIWASVPGPAGTVFFGNYDNVLEFDGLAWRSIPVPNGVFIRALAKDTAGTIWVAGVNELGRLRAGPDGRLAYESLRALVPAELGDLGPVWCVHTLPDGVYFQSNLAVLRWRDGKFDVWPMRETKTVLSFRLGDRLLVARAEGWFEPRPGGQWAPFFPEARNLGTFPGLPRFFLPRADGRWLVGSAVNGLFSFDGQTLTPAPTSIDPFLRTQKLYSGLRLPDGCYVLNTLQGGAVVLDGDLRCELLLDEAAGMPTHTVIHAAVDARGVVWFGTDQGVVRAELNSPVTWFGEANGLGRAGVNAVGRWQDRFFALGGRGWFQLNPPAHSPGNPGFALRPDLSDKLNTALPYADGQLVGALGGLWWLTAETAKKIEGPTNVRELAVLPLQPGRIVGLHLNGVATWRREGQSWRYEGDLPTPRGEFRSLVATPDGDVWIGTAKDGAWRVRWPRPDAPPETKLFDGTAGLPEGFNRTWVHFVDGAPLFLTARGFFRFDPALERYLPETRYGPRFADGSTGARYATPDHRGGLWLEALPRDPTIPPQLGYASAAGWTPLAITGYTRLGDVQSIRHEIAPDGGELLWLVGLTGLARVDLTAWRAQPPADPGVTLVRSVATPTGRLLTHENAPPAHLPLRLRAEENSVRFAFATPDLAGESPVQHETRLRGFVDGGVELATTGERIFTNLPSGSYVFEARARTGDGRWSTPATFAFTVLAPWWQTGWARGAYALALLAGIYGIVRLRTRLLERERARLEAVVTSRTTELAHKNTELERLNQIEHDEKLTARLAEEKTRLELLRYQLNPHFLFNSLNSIRALVHANPPQADEMVTRLADFCRQTLTRGSDELTTVAEEIEMLRTYLDIEKVRWQEALDVRYVVDPAVHAERLPQFLLLPLVENAIKYGGQTSPGTLVVEIAVARENGLLICSVANTGRWLAPEPRNRILAKRTNPASTRIGLDNLRERLTRHYGPACAYEIDASGQPGWVRITLRLPERISPVPPRSVSRDPFADKLP